MIRPVANLSEYFDRFSKLLRIHVSHHSDLLNRDRLIQVFQQRKSLVTYPYRDKPPVFFRATPREQVSAFNRSNNLVISGSRVIMRAPMSLQVTPESPAPRRIRKTLYCVGDNPNGRKTSVTSCIIASAVR